MNQTIKSLWDFLGVLFFSALFVILFLHISKRWCDHRHGGPPLREAGVREKK